MTTRSEKGSASYGISLEFDNRTTNNTTVAGAAVDLAGYESAEIITYFGDWADSTTGGIEFGVQHSDDTISGNFVDVPNAELTDTIAAASTVTGAMTTGVYAFVNDAAEDDPIYTTYYKGNKRYLRAKVMANGNQSTGFESGVVIRRGKPANKPV